MEKFFFHHDINLQAEINCWENSLGYTWSPLTCRSVQVCETYPYGNMLFTFKLKHKKILSNSLSLSPSTWLFFFLSLSSTSKRSIEDAFKMNPNKKKMESSETKDELKLFFYVLPKKTNKPKKESRYGKIWDESLTTAVVSYDSVRIIKTRFFWL